MTAEARQRLRDAINVARREQVAAEDELFGTPKCGGCGGDRDGWTLGCKVCSSRHRSKMERGTHPQPNFYQFMVTMTRAHAETRRRAFMEATNGNRIPLEVT